MGWAGDESGPLVSGQVPGRRWWAPGRWAGQRWLWAEGGGLLTAAGRAAAGAAYVAAAAATATATATAAAWSRGCCGHARWK